MTGAFMISTITEAFMMSKAATHLVDCVGLCRCCGWKRLIGGGEEVPQWSGRLAAGLTRLWEMEVNDTLRWQ